MKTELRPSPTRRAWLLTALSLPAAAEAPSAFDAAARLRQGHAVVLLRHAEAPGLYDPPGMVLGDCATQRNLDATGREQARRLGAWFRAQPLPTLRVRSSPWCRCLDTAQLAFGQAEPWDALASPVQSDGAARQAQVSTLRQALRALSADRLEVWVTHNFVIADLTGLSLASAEGLVLAGGSEVRILGRLNAP